VSGAAAQLQPLMICQFANQCHPPEGHTMNRGRRQLDMAILPMRSSRLGRPAKSGPVRWLACRRRSATIRQCWKAIDDKQPTSSKQSGRSRCK
jgi:hypothetical protein